MRRPPLPKHPKVRGELAETIFVSAAMRHGFRVCKPYGETAPYDFMVERDGEIRRVQVKSTDHWGSHRGGGYGLHTAFNPNVKRPDRLYTRRDLDFVAGYIFRRDTWYIIPVECIHATMVHVRPGKGRGQFERFREAWHLLTEPGGLSAARRSRRIRYPAAGSRSPDSIPANIR